jgi:hypothetical protein
VFPPVWEWLGLRVRGNDRPAQISTGAASPSQVNAGALAAITWYMHLGADVNAIDCTLSGSNKPPVVLCPGCKKPMKAGKPKPLASRDMVEIAYVCESCGMTTKRALKQGK